MNSISPAVIQTPILDQLNQEQINMMLSKIPLGRTGKPEEVAALVHFLSSSECSLHDRTVLRHQRGTSDLLTSRECRSAESAVGGPIRH